MSFSSQIKANNPDTAADKACRSDSAKQEHQSWGGDDGKRELEAENAGGADAAAEKTNADGTATPAVAEGAETPAPAADAAPATPAEPEDNSKTYEEYMAERKAALNSKLGVPEARKANEGADDSQWKDGVAITKPANGEDNYYVGTQKVCSIDADSFGIRY